MSLCKRQWKTENKAEEDWVMHIVGVNQSNSKRELKILV